MSTIIIVCSNCKKKMGEKKSTRSSDDGSISHGICKPCAMKLYPEEIWKTVFPDEGR